MTVPAVPVTVPAIPVTVPAVPVTVPAVPVTVPAIPVTSRRSGDGPGDPGDVPAILLLPDRKILRSRGIPTSNPCKSPKTPESAAKGGSELPKSGQSDQSDSEGEGGELPKTATTYPLMSFVGSLIMAAGLALLKIRLSRLKTPLGDLPLSSRSRQGTVTDFDALG